MHLDDLKSSYESTFAFYDENVNMLSWYVDAVMETFKNKNYTNLLSLGLGHGVVASHIINHHISFLQSYTIIEGSQEIINNFQADNVLPPDVSVVHSLFEDAHFDKSFDAIDMGFILEHVDDPLLVLKKYSMFLQPGGTIFLSVPNALSLHRQIGCNANMLSDLYALSDHDKQLGHQRYFDLEYLSAIVDQAGLKIMKTKGTFLKPFSTSQLKSMGLSPEILMGLYKTGETLPNIANAIYMETCKE